MKKIIIASLTLAFMHGAAFSAFADVGTLSTEQLRYMQKTSPFAKIIIDNYGSYDDFLTDSDEPCRFSVSPMADAFILYGTADVQFQTVMNETAQKKGNKLLLEIYDESGKKLYSKQHYLNIDIKVPIDDLLKQKFGDSIDREALKKGIIFNTKATLLDDIGVKLATAQAGSFAVATANFNITENGTGFQLAGLGASSEHPLCYTACDTHSRIIEWNDFCNADYLVTLKRGGKTVLNTVIDENRFDVSKYYLPDSPDTEYSVTVSVRSRGTTGVLADNSMTANFIVEKHSNVKPVIDSVSCDYARALFKISNYSSADVRISVSGSDGKVLYEDYLGQQLPKGSYTAKAYLRRMPCADSSAKLSFSVTSAQVSTGKVLSQTVEMISSREGTYNTVDKADGNSMSIGKICWHGTNAQLLLKRIMNADPGELYNNLSGTVLYDDIFKSDTFWSTRKCTDSEKPILQKAISTEKAKLIQDAYADEFIYEYVSYGRNRKNISNNGALMFYCDLCVQGGSGAANRVVNDISGEITLDSIYQASIVDKTFKNYIPRRSAIYEYIKDLSYTK